MTGRLGWANALRGIAALLVLAFHFLVVFWTNQDVAAGLARRDPLYPGDERAPVLARALAAVPLDLGALGVGLFFVISGFVIALSLERYTRRGFLAGRAFRVLPTYAAGFLVTCAVVALLGDPAGELGPGAVVAGAVPGLALVLGVTAPGDGIVWTLIIELLFYGVAVVVHRRLTRGWTGVVAVAVACVALQLLVPAPTVLAGSSRGGIAYVVLLACPFLPLMLAGVLLSSVSGGRVGGRTAAGLVPALVVLHVVLLSTSPLFAATAVYRASFVVAVGVFVGAWWVGTRWRPGRFFDGTAGISYPLYVVHPVLGYATISVLAARGVPSLVAVLAAAGVAILAATLLHVAVEKPTHRLGRRVARALDARGRTQDEVAGPDAVPEGAGRGLVPR